MFISSVFIVRRLLVVILMASLVEGIQFDCTFQMETPWNVLGPRYTCFKAKIVNSGSTSLENVTGDHMTGKSNDDVEYLYIVKQNLTIIPENLADFFKNLDALSISSTNLISISANDLRPFPRLRNLDLYDNLLTTIDGDLFKYTPHLQRVSFYCNQIKHIGYDLVTNLNDLTELLLEENVCINHYAENRSGVLSLASQLSVLCPPLETTTATTTATTTTTSAATENPTGKCFYDEQIQELRELSRGFKSQIEDLQKTNVEQDKKIEQLQASNNELSAKNQKQHGDFELLQQKNENLLQEIDAFVQRILQVKAKMPKIGSK